MRIERGQLGTPALRHPRGSIARVIDAGWVFHAHHAPTQALLAGATVHEPDDTTDWGATDTILTGGITTFDAGERSDDLSHVHTYAETWKRLKLADADGASDWLDGDYRFGHRRDHPLAEYLVFVREPGTYLVCGQAISVAEPSYRHHTYERPHLDWCWTGFGLAIGSNVGTLAEDRLCLADDDSHIIARRVIHAVSEYGLQTSDAIEAMLREYDPAWDYRAAEESLAPHGTVLPPILYGPSPGVGSGPRRHSLVAVVDLDPDDQDRDSIGCIIGAGWTARYEVAPGETEPFVWPDDYHTMEAAVFADPVASAHGCVLYIMRLGD